MTADKDDPSRPSLASLLLALWRKCVRTPGGSPAGRLSIPEKLPRVDIELLPFEVQEKGLEAFERVGEDVMERRPASLVGPADRSGPRSRVRPGRWP
jgi:hypothetical protein